MESFLVKFEPNSAISIITALYKHVEAGEWTDVREEEIKNFNKVLNKALDAIPINDVARLTKLREFGSGDILTRRISEAFDDVYSLLELNALNVEVPWVVNASKNFETLKNEVHKVAMSAIEEEKTMWEAVESELQEIKIEDLGYDHLLCSEILDDSSVPFTKMPEDLRQIFNASSKKFLIPNNSILKKFCEDFVRKEKNKCTEKLPKSFGSTKYRTFLDNPEKLKEITNEMLLVLRRVWESPKWKAYIETEAVVNEGSYVCEVISSLLNITVSDLPVDTDIWGVWAEQASSASAQRKGSYKSARRPDFMVIAQDHKKLNRLAKDAIDTTTNSKNDGVFREDAKIPLHIPSKIDDVYQFIHALLTFRTAIACTLRNILHTTDDSAEMMSISSDMTDMTDRTNVSNMMTSSQTSISTVNSLPRSTSGENNQSSVTTFCKTNSDVSFEDKEINFLERVHKEQIRNEIREKNQKKKLQRETAIQDLTDNKESTFSIKKDDQDSNLSWNDQDSNLFCDTKTINSGNNQTEIEQDDEYDKNQIVEQGLIEELYLFTKEQSLIDSIIDNTSSTEINVSCSILENKSSAQHLSVHTITTDGNDQIIAEVSTIITPSIQSSNSIDKISEEVSQSEDAIASKFSPETEVNIPTESYVPPKNNPKINSPKLYPLKKMLSKEKRKEVINKLNMHFTDSPKVDLYFSIDKEDGHQTDTYWVFGSHCPLCKENHMSLQDKWWSDNQGNKFYYLYCDNIKDPGSHST
ncbi:23167_t:CDS:10, partial [Gigaspora margarita]